MKSICYEMKDGTRGQKACNRLFWSDVKQEMNTILKRENVVRAWIAGQAIAYTLTDNGEMKGAY